MVDNDKSGDPHSVGEVLDQLQEAWAWADQNWPAFLPVADPFLVDLFHRGEDYCRRKYGAATGEGGRATGH